MRELAEIEGLTILGDQPSLYRYSYDGMKRSFLPSLVLQIHLAEAVGFILKLANKKKIPVVTRGSGSSLTGSAAPLQGGWVLDLSPLKKVRIDTKNRLCQVQSGVIVEKLQAAARKKNLYYPPDPSSVQWCTIGGNIACNAGGLHCTKYGVTRDYVLGLKGYLPTGEFVEWGRSTRKFATGYNIRDLWVGSEGTLGVITEAYLRLIPKPTTRWATLAIFPTEEKALVGSLELLQQGVQPAVMEFLDILSVKGAEQAIGKPLFSNVKTGAVLLIELDGTPLSVREEKKICLEWLREKALDFSQAKTETAIEKLWSVRRKCSSAMFELGDLKLNEDISVPLDKQVTLIRFVKKLRRESKLPIAVFGHAGDGNLHVNIMYHSNKIQEKKQAAKAVDSLMKKVVALGGAISGEHGVGLAKTPFMCDQFRSIEIETMKKIKNVLDPHNILNPGKLFNPFAMWEMDPVNVMLPWDHKK